MGMQPPLRPRHRGSLKTVLFGNVIDRNLRGRAHNYIPQCGLASLSLFLILVVEDTLIGVAIVVAVASTAFTTFVYPNSITSTPRRVLGGHTVAALSGAAMPAILLFCLWTTQRLTPGSLWTSQQPCLSDQGHC